MPQLRDKYDHIGAIIAYESGELEDDEAVELFQHLADTGILFSLQGSYGRTGQALADAGYITL